MSEADEKGTAGSREHPVDVQIRELKLKAKLVQQKLELEQQKLELEHREDKMNVQPNKNENVQPD